SRRRHTRSKRDWSSDVCSSDLYVRQKEALGLGHAILMARELVGEEPFAVLLGDDIIDASPPCLRQMLDVYESHPGSIIAIQEVRSEERRVGKECGSGWWRDA